MVMLTSSRVVGPRGLIHIVFETKIHRWLIQRLDTFGFLWVQEPEQGFGWPLSTCWYPSKSLPSYWGRQQFPFLFEVRHRNVEWMGNTAKLWVLWRLPEKLWEGFAKQELKGSFSLESWTRRKSRILTKYFEQRMLTGISGIWQGDRRSSCHK